MPQAILLSQSAVAVTKRFVRIVYCPANTNLSAASGDLLTTIKDRFYALGTTNEQILAGLQTDLIANIIVLSITDLN